MVIHLAIAVLPGGDDVLSMGSKTLREQLSIGFIFNRGAASEGTGSR